MLGSDILLQVFNSVLIKGDSSNPAHMDWSDHLKTHNEADGSQSISGVRAFITEIVVMQEVGREQFAYL